MSIWRNMVNGWLSKAERVELPPEASTEPAIREEIERIIEDMPVGEEPEDLDHDKCVLLGDGRRALKVTAIHHRLRDDHPEANAQLICRLLKGMGYSSGTERINGKNVRVWRRDSETPVYARGT